MSGGRAAPARIRRLSDTLANQIAAGEVVERPASVLKELVENALDAGASRIDIEARAGGVALIRVRDDGVGIEREDLPLALDRHATSKIRTFDDVVAIRSLGFRGEALPSIASVSRFELSSRAAGADMGWTIAVEGGAASADPAPCPQPQGTTVTVRDLFYNTPARRKFLRTERTETRHLDDVARRMALAWPEVAMRFVHAERSSWSVVAAGDTGGRLRRLATLCGRAFADAALEVDVAATGLALHGWVGGPEADRAHADLQHFFVNGRAVVDPVVRHAVRQGLGEAVPQGRQPAYVLFLDLEPEQVDVNVHPAKREVRYREARLVHDFVHRALTRTLAGDGAGVLVAHPGVASHADPGLTGPGPTGSGPTGSGPTGSGLGGSASGPGAIADTIAAYARLHPPTTASHGSLAIGDRHLAVPAAGGLVLVDLDRARRAWLGGRWAADPDAESIARPLLVPISRTLDEDAAERIEGLADALGAIGIDVRRSAPCVVSLRRVPRLLERADPAALLDAIASVLPEAGSGELPDDLVGRLLAALDLAAGWRPDAADTARLLADLEAVPGIEKAHVVLDAARIGRLIRDGR